MARHPHLGRSALGDEVPGNLWCWAVEFIVTTVVEKRVGRVVTGRVLWILGIVIGPVWETSNSECKQPFNIFSISTKLLSIRLNSIWEEFSATVSLTLVSNEAVATLHISNWSFFIFLSLLCFVGFPIEIQMDTEMKTEYEYSDLISCFIFHILTWLFTSEDENTSNLAT